jgi:hypothetical protein
VSKLEVPAKISLTESCYSDGETTEPRSAIDYAEVITLKVLRSSWGDSSYLRGPNKVMLPRIRCESSLSG